MKTPLRNYSLQLVLVCISLVSLRCQAPAEEKPPNVILIITDDQGYGDFGVHGNEMIQTPNLDELWTESVRLTNFHVDPTCSPTRSALMSGRYSTRTGVWHTIMGRSLMDPDEQTLAEVFQENGYRTGMLGKWHLGDNYPLRPQDQGFEEVVWHKGGGVGQGPDYWGNDYFDDTYWRGDQPEAFEGYCTDVWFSEASRFVEENKDEPFFLYLSTNAPHGPFLVDEKYSKPYADQGVPAPMDAFYGMITNIDENVGRLRSKLEELGLAENTLLIYMSDNGTAAGVSRVEDAAWKGFNAGMRGIKGSEYEGGHRTPFMMHWPANAMNSGRDVNQLAAHIDVMPTLVDMLGLEKPAGPSVDGTSIKAAVEGDASVLRDRTLFVHSQRVEDPVKWRKSAVMTEQWRLVNQNELYDVQADPGQENDVAAEHPDVVTRLQADYEGWWQSLTPGFDEYVRIAVGNEAENPVEFMSHDWHTDNEAVPWHQRHVEAGLISNGYWAIDVEETGTYEVSLFRWPDQEDKAMEAQKARVRFNTLEATTTLSPEATEATFEVELNAGPATLQGWLTNEEGEEYGAYFVKVTKL
ncbi:MAG: arylsulfatase [Rhodothermales bacterium]